MGILAGTKGIIPSELKFTVIIVFRLLAVDLYCINETWWTKCIHEVRALTPLIVLRSPNIIPSWFEIVKCIVCLICSILFIISSLSALIIYTQSFVR